MTIDVFQFYESREIFITGGSGFIGKGLIEKIFRSLNVNRLYMLLRPKKNKSLEQRLEELKKDCVFDRLKREKPNELSKLVAVAGDISELGLGLSAESIELMKNVSVIFHSAATVRFDEPLPKAVCLNVRGTREALKFAETLKHLVAFVHVSTLYCNPYLDFVDEKVYPGPVDWENCIKMSETVPEYLINPITEKYIQHFPNTYTFTKNLAERVVYDFQHKVPVVIIRPSIVVAALVEPEPGYLASKTGTMGVLSLIGTGFFRTLIGNPSTKFDQIPVDVVARLSILLAWQRGTNQEPWSKNLPYLAHSSAESYKKIKVTELAKHSKQALKKYPHEISIWLPSFKVTGCWYYYFLRTILYQIFPSLFIDAILKLFGQQPFLMKIQRMIYSTLDLLRFFVFNTFRASKGNAEYISRIVDNIPEFSFEPYRTLATNDFKSVCICTLGTRRHIVKYKDSTIKKSRKLYKILYFVDKVSHMILYYIIAKLTCLHLILPTLNNYNIISNN